MFTSRPYFREVTSYLDGALPLTHKYDSMFNRIA